MTRRPITFATLVYSVALFILFFMPACSLLTCPEKGCAEPVVHYGEGRGPAAEAPAEAPSAPAEAPAPSAPSEGKGHGGHHGHGGKGGHHGKGDHDDGHDDDGDDD